MDPSQRKRLHVQPNLVPDSFLRKYAASVDSTIGHTPPRLPSTRMSVASPHSPAVRASPSLLSTRKILDRPHGPSSRLGSSTIRKTSNLAAPIPRGLFASSASNGSTARFTFSPHVRAEVAKESFPPATPGRSLRASTADMTGRGMARTAGTAGTNLFHMKIPEPDPELDGEALAKQVPDDPNRVGSIYADEYLAHLCPPELDDLQRRQFFCILDLRRLKYAANDVFAKKDWKINIMNFAKEYEKSRSLIMLRYGLYEFRTVPVSSEVMKKWKAENNIPEEEDKDDDEEEEEEADEAPTPRPNGTRGILARSSNKRRAEDDLTKDSFIAASSNTNKRRAQDREPLSESVNAATPAPAKNKRRAEVLDEADENQRNKMQKAPPSATKSLFESIANKRPAFAPAASTTPAKTPAKNPFEPSAANPPANPFATLHNGGSVLGGGFKAGAAGKNIFGHLSEESSAKGSGNEDADAEETEDESEPEEESEAQEVSQSDDASAAASGGAATPSQVGTALFSVNKTGAFAASTAPSEAGEARKAPSLFERITRDKNGEPVRATFGLNGDAGSKPAGDGPAPGLKRAASPVKDAPADKTWKPDTPIKFGGASAPSFFGAATTPSSTLFGSKPAATTPSLFQKAPEGPKTDTQDFAPSAKPTDSNRSAFSYAATPLFGAHKKADEGGKAATASNAFSANSDSVLKPKSQPSTLFGPSTIAATPAATGNLFGSGNAAKPSSNLFGSATSQPAPAAGQTPSPFGASAGQPALFGAKPTPAPEKTESAAPEPAKPSGGDDAASVFGAPSGQNGAAKSFTFGGPAPPPAANLPPKTTAAAKGATDAAAVFGAASGGEKKFTFGGSAAAPASSTPAPLFGGSTPAATEAPKSNLFGAAAAPSETPKPRTNLFGSSTAPSETPKPQPILFGGSTATSEAPKTQTTLFGSTAPTETPKPRPTLFGASSAAPSEAKPAATSFTFGNSANTSNVFGAGSNPTDNNVSNTGSGLFGGGGGGGGGSFTFSTGGAGTSFNNPFASGNSSAPPSFNFGSDPAPTNQSSSTAFAFGAGSSTPSAPASTSSSFTFGANTQQPAAAPVFGGANNNAGGSSMFGFSAGAPPGQSVFSQPPANAAQSMFGGHLGVPGGGSSTGTNTPFFGGASSLATTPATGTPEPEAKQEAKQQDEGNQADEDGKPQEQISLTEGGPGEEDEDVVYEVRAKALKFVPEKPGSDTEDAKKDKKNPWKTQGVGPLRLLKHKTSGAVRILLRAEPRGHIAMNRGVLPNVEYKVDNGGKYVKVTTGNDSGSGLETWMLQVKTNQAALALAEALEKNKSANKK